jgi:hypothetical protein
VSPHALKIGRGYTICPNGGYQENVEEQIKMLKRRSLKIVGVYVHVATVILAKY